MSNLGPKTRCVCALVHLAQKKHCSTLRNRSPLEPSHCAIVQQEISTHAAQTCAELASSQRFRAAVDESQKTALQPLAGSADRGVKLLEATPVTETQTGRFLEPDPHNTDWSSSRLHMKRHCSANIKLRHHRQGTEISEMRGQKPSAPLHQYLVRKRLRAQARGPANAMQNSAASHVATVARSCCRDLRCSELLPPETGKHARLNSEARCSCYC
jgi:hypothetical protein